MICLHTEDEIATEGSTAVVPREPSQDGSVAPKADSEKKLWMRKSVRRS